MLTPAPTRNRPATNDDFAGPAGIDRLVTLYAELELRLHAAVGELSGGICARCPSPCCRGDHCSVVLGSPWLLRVTRHEGMEPDNERDTSGNVCFLGPAGCRLPAGRPVHCTQYVCDRLELSIRDPLDRFIYQVLSSVLGFVARNAHGSVDLTDVEDLGRLTNGQRAKLAGRIREADRAVIAAARLRGQRAHARPVEETAQRMIRLCRAFPFAAGAVRFPGEPPRVSRASRKRNARQDDEPDRETHA